MIMIRQRRLPFMYRRRHSPTVLCRWVRLLIVTILLLLHVPLAVHADKASLGIPGATQTDSGYDTERGDDPICWRSQSAETNTDNGSVKIPNALLDDFRIDKTKGVQLLRACPVGNFLWAEAPVEKRLENETLRTGSVYWYNVSGTVNLTSLVENAIGVWPNEENEENDASTTTSMKTPMVYADNGPQASLQILLCELGKAGFCSPFIHEEANARLAAVDQPVNVSAGDSHGGTHVHSPYGKVDLMPEDGPIYRFSDVKIPVLVNEPATFYAIAAFQVYLLPAAKNSSRNNHTFSQQLQQQRNDGSVLLRYDMANALADPVQRIIRYQKPAMILNVKDSVLYFSYVAIGLSAAILLWLLGCTIYHRQHQVLQLTQGDFLICFLLAGLVAVVTSVLTAPVNDTYCRFSLLLIMIPLQLMYAITVGRLWRINSVISPLLVETIRKRQEEENTVSVAARLWRQLRRFSAAATRRASAAGIMSRDLSSTFSGGNGGGSGSAMAFHRRRSSSVGQPRNLRKQVTSEQLAKVVAACTLPQVLLQVVAIIFQPREKYIELNAEESKGRSICTDGVAAVGASLDMYGYYLFCGLVLVLLFMAHTTRALPSLFNETRVIFDSTVTTIAMLCLGVGIILATDSPTTDPSIHYLIVVALILSFTLNASLRIMLPKLKMVWRDEKVIVSQLVSDHRRRMSQPTMTTRHHTGGPQVNVTGLDPPPNYHHNSLAAAAAAGVTTEKTVSTISATNSNSQQIIEDIEYFVDGTERGEEEDGDEQDNKEDDDDEEKNNSVTNDTREFELFQNGDANTETMPLEPKAVRFSKISAGLIHGGANSRRSNTNTSSSTRSNSAEFNVLIRRDKAPSRRLVLRMYSLQEKLSRLNHRITTGLAPSERDWEDVRRLTHRLDTTFEDSVRFEWEIDQQQQQQQQQEEEAAKTRAPPSPRSLSASAASVTASIYKHAPSGEQVPAQAAPSQGSGIRSSNAAKTSLVAESSAATQVEEKKKEAKVLAVPEGGADDDTANRLGDTTDGFDDEGNAGFQKGQRFFL